MSDDSQWREKYRDSLSRLSAEEVRRSRLQSVLRVLIGRLCVAGQGRDPRLDAELHKVAAAVRKGIDPQGLEDLLDPLAQAITVLESPANRGRRRRAGGERGEPPARHRSSISSRSCPSCGR